MDILWCYGPECDYAVFDEIATISCFGAETCKGLIYQSGSTIECSGLNSCEGVSGVCKAGLYTGTDGCTACPPGTDAAVPGVGALTSRCFVTTGADNVYLTENGIQECLRESEYCTATVYKNTCNRCGGKTVIKFSDDIANDVDRTSSSSEDGSGGRRKQMFAMIHALIFFTCVLLLLVGYRWWVGSRAARRTQRNGPVEEGDADDEYDLESIAATAAPSKSPIQTSPDPRHRGSIVLQLQTFSSFDREMEINGLTSGFAESGYDVVIDLQNRAAAFPDGAATPVGTGDMSYTDQTDMERASNSTVDMACMGLAESYCAIDEEAASCTRDDSGYLVSSSDWAEPDSEHDDGVQV